MEFLKDYIEDMLSALTWKDLAPSEGSTEHVHSWHSLPPADSPRSCLKLWCGLGLLWHGPYYFFIGAAKSLGIDSSLKYHHPLVTWHSAQGSRTVADSQRVSFSLFKPWLPMLASVSPFCLVHSARPASPADSSGSTDFWHQEIN